jgi:hypothetical protein
MRGSCPLAGQQTEFVFRIADNNDFILMFLQLISQTSADSHGLKYLQRGCQQSCSHCKNITLAEVNQNIDSFSFLYKVTALKISHGQMGDLRINTIFKFRL